jgi:hypothetical protein
MLQITQPFEALDVGARIISRRVRKKEKCGGTGDVGVAERKANYLEASEYYSFLWI